MSMSQCFFLCLCFFAVNCYSTGSLAPFIDKCKWSDKACLAESTRKAIPYFSEGLSDLGIEPMDPLKMDEVTLAEGDLKVVFTGMKVTGASKCKVIKVERDINKNLLILAFECPIDMVGQYDASGTLLFVPIEGKGSFNVNCKNIAISLDIELTTVVGKDGVKYWKCGKTIHTYEVKEKVTMNFENLFNGDKEKADPILKIFNDNWKDIMYSVGKPIVNKVISKMERRQ